MFRLVVLTLEAVTVCEAVLPTEVLTETLLGVTESGAEEG